MSCQPLKHQIVTRRDIMISWCRNIAYWLASGAAAAIFHLLQLGIAPKPALSPWTIMPTLTASYLLARYFVHEQNTNRVIYYTALSSALFWLGFLVDDLAKNYAVDSGQKHSRIVDSIRLHAAIGHLVVAEAEWRMHKVRFARQPQRALRSCSLLLTAADI